MDSFSTFINMGGYAVFVWSSYALAVAGLMGVLIFSRRSVKARQAELDRLRPPSSATTSSDESAQDQSPREPAHVSLTEGAKSP